jgi:hypothetical protein
MARVIVLVLTGLLFAGAALALSTDKDRQPPPGQAATQTNRPADNKGGSRQSGRPARTFTPTEKIGADSAVSFPVDI